MTQPAHNQLSGSALKRVAAMRNVALKSIDSTRTVLKTHASTASGKKAADSYRSISVTSASR
jgi:hypothetical protein